MLEFSHPTWEIKDSSKLDTFLKCPRKYLFEYILGIRNPNENVHLVFGRAVHSAMEVLLWKGFGKAALEEAILAARKVYRGTYTSNDEDMLPELKVKNLTNLLYMLEYYVEEYSNDEFELIGTEIGGTVPIPNSSHRIHFTLDCLLWMRDLLWVLDHKTTGMSLGDNWEMQWNNKIQIRIYTLATCLYAIENKIPLEKFGGFILNGIGMKVNKKDPKDNRKVILLPTSDYLILELQRVEIPADPVLISSWAAEFATWLDFLDYNMELLQKSSIIDPLLLAFPRCGGGECTSFNRACPHYSQCLLTQNPLSLWGTNYLDFENNTPCFWNPAENPSRIQFNPTVESIQNANG